MLGNTCCNMVSLNTSCFVCENNNKKKLPRVQATNGLCCDLVVKLYHSFRIFLAMFFPTVSDCFAEQFKEYVIKNVVYALWLERDEVSKMTMQEFCELEKPDCKLLAKLSFKQLQSAT